MKACQGGGNGRQASCRFREFAVSDGTVASDNAARVAAANASSTDVAHAFQVPAYSCNPWLSAGELT